ncbi:PPOX class F420-dependent oxidoreductase [Myxococcota bacterium]|nr:PPOX class F420-dependent oxidoreductase [Myxococcota bacterium]
MFARAELDYLTTQRLARLATVSSEGQPTVDAVTFRFDGAAFWIHGLDLTATRKYKNIAAGNTKVSLIIDDLASIEPWRPRGIRVHATAEIADHEGRPALRIRPKRSWSWGLGGEDFATGKFTPNRIDWTT